LIVLKNQLDFSDFGGNSYLKEVGVIIKHEDLRFGVFAYVNAQGKRIILYFVDKAN